MAFCSEDRWHNAFKCLYQFQAIKIFIVIASSENVDPLSVDETRLVTHFFMWFNLTIWSERSRKMFLHSLALTRMKILRQIHIKLKNSYWHWDGEVKIGLSTRFWKKFGDLIELNLVSRRSIRKTKWHRSQTRFNKNRWTCCSKRKGNIGGEYWSVLILWFSLPIIFALFCTFALFNIQLN